MKKGVHCNDEDVLTDWDSGWRGVKWRAAVEGVRMKRENEMWG